jgi:hypothetical protein
MDNVSEGSLMNRVHQKNLIEMEEKKNNLIFGED